MEADGARPPPPPQTTTALAKHACAACGAQAEWHPGRQLLICPFCGTEARFEVDADGSPIEELDLLQALREPADGERGWLEARRSVLCQSCRAVSVFEAERVGQLCDFCGSPSLVDYEEARAPIRPRSLLPFRLPEHEARAALRRWLRRRWFAPGDLKRRALIDQVHGVYLPYWTFDAQVHCPWRAQSGTYYYTTQTYRDAKGRRRTRRVRHVRWRPASGAIDHFFDDVPVAGTTGVDAGLLRAIEPFPRKELVPYDTAYLSGFVVEHYQVVLVDAATRSRRHMEQRLRTMCAAAVPGDTYRALEIEPGYSGETFKLTLAPVWILAYDYGSRRYQVVANGVTGRVAGNYPKSFWKIAGLAILLALIVILVVVFGRA